MFRWRARMLGVAGDGEQPAAARPPESRQGGIGMTIDCRDCGRKFDSFATGGTCPECGAELEVCARER